MSGPRDNFRAVLSSFQMKAFFVLATLASVASAASVYPAGVDPAACPNYPFCVQGSPADFPVPIVNGQPVAPILNTLPEQTLFWQQVNTEIQLRKTAPHVQQL
jgi:hypothetical protein